MNKIKRSQNHDLILMLDITGHVMIMLELGLYEFYVYVLLNFKSFLILVKPYLRYPSSKFFCFFHRTLGSSKFCGSTASDKEYFKIFP